MSTITEGRHTGEFLLSEANGSLSRESRTLKSGEKVVDGQLVSLNGGKLVATPGDLDTEGALETAVEGIVLGDHDASATGTNADIKGVPYIARLAEVRDAYLVYPDETTEGGQKAAAVSALADLLIVPR